MPPRKNWHALGVTLTAEALETVFGSNYWVRQQYSLDLSPHSVPDPDIAVVEGPPRQWRQAQNPKTALLIVEVSDTTLAYDRGRKSKPVRRIGHRRLLDPEPGGGPAGSVSATPHRCGSTSSDLGTRT